jgi:hypothetical protein
MLQFYVKIIYFYAIITDTIPTVPIVSKSQVGELYRIQISPILVIQFFISVFLKIIVCTKSI